MQSAGIDVRTHSGDEIVEGRRRADVPDAPACSWLRLSGGAFSAEGFYLH
jgi:hypothetical protein